MKDKLLMDSKKDKEWCALPTVISTKVSITSTPNTEKEFTYGLTGIYTVAVLFETCHHKGSWRRKTGISFYSLQYNLRRLLKRSKRLRTSSKCTSLIKMYELSHLRPVPYSNDFWRDVDMWYCTFATKLIAGVHISPPISPVSLENTYHSVKELE